MCFSCSFLALIYLTPYNKNSIIVYQQGKKPLIMPNTRVGLYSKARKRATSSKLRERSPSDGLQAPSPRDARLQARAAAAAELLESLSEEEADNDPISDDAISTDPTTRMINYGDEALVYPTGTAVVNGDDDNGNDDIDGVNDKGQEDGNNEGEDDIDDVDEGKGKDEDEVMAGMAPRAVFRVPNQLSDAGGEFAVELKFNSIDDFRPEAVVQQVEPLRQLLEARSKLADLRNKLAGNEKLEDVLAEVLNNTEQLKQLGHEATPKE